MKNLQSFLRKLMVRSLLAAVGFFVVTFIIYFFNLDMKLTALVEPLLQKWYDYVKRDQHL